MIRRVKLALSDDDIVMHRRSLVAGIALVLAVPATCQTQPADRIPQIGVIVVSEPAAPNEPNVSAFRQGLRDLGYSEMVQRGPSASHHHTVLGKALTTPWAEPRSRSLTGSRA